MDRRRTVQPRRPRTRWADRRRGQPAFGIVGAFLPVPAVAVVQVIAQYVRSQIGAAADRGVARQHRRRRRCTAGRRPRRGILSRPTVGQPQASLRVRRVHLGRQTARNFLARRACPSVNPVQDRKGPAIIRPAIPLTRFCRPAGAESAPTHVIHFELQRTAGTSRPVVRMAKPVRGRAPLVTEKSRDGSSVMITDHFGSVTTTRCHE